MPECSKCGENVSMPFKCKFCENSFCSRHRLPENHDCEGLREYKDRSRKEGKVGYDAIREEEEHRVEAPSQVSGESWSRKLERYLPASVTVTVLAVMASGFVLEYTIPGFFEAFALYPEMSAFTQPWRLVTSLFLHGSLLHLLVNSIVLWSFGRHIEEILGKARFIQVLLVSGLVSSLAITVSGIALGTEIPAIGISGALFGLVTFLAVVRPDVRVLAFFIIPLRIRHAVAFFAAIDTWNLVAQIMGMAGPYQLVFGPQIQIGSAAHLAGLLVGALYGYAWKDRYRRQRPVSVWEMI